MTTNFNNQIYISFKMVLRNEGCIMHNGIESVVLLDMNRLLTLNERVENVQCGVQHSDGHSKLFHLRKVKSMQRLGAEAIRS